MLLPVNYQQQRNLQNVSNCDINIFYTLLGKFIKMSRNFFISRNIKQEKFIEEIFSDEPKRNNLHQTDHFALICYKRRRIFIFRLLGNLKHMFRKIFRNLAKFHQLTTNLCLNYKTRLNCHCHFDNLQVQQLNNLT